jgi:hypothetical protein
LKPYRGKPRGRAADEHSYVGRPGRVDHLDEHLTSVRQRIGDPGQFRTFIVGGDLLPVVEIEVKTAIAALRQENKLARAAVPGQSKTFLI